MTEKELKELMKCGLGSQDQMEKLLCFLDTQYVQKIIVDLSQELQDAFKQTGVYSLYDNGGVFYGFVVASYGKKQNWIYIGIDTNSGNTVIRSTVDPRSTIDDLLTHTTLDFLTQNISSENSALDEAIANACQRNVETGTDSNLKATIIDLGHKNLLTHTNTIVDVDDTQVGGFNLFLYGSSDFFSATGEINLFESSTQTVMTITISNLLIKPINSSHRTIATNSNGGAGCVAYQITNSGNDTIITITFNAGANRTIYFVLTSGESFEL